MSRESVISDILTDEEAETIVNQALKTPVPPHKRKESVSRISGSMDPSGTVGGSMTINIPTALRAKIPYRPKDRVWFRTVELGHKVFLVIYQR